MTTREVLVGSIRVAFVACLVAACGKVPAGSHGADAPGSSSTCSDGMLDGDETGIDCGGSCPACPACVVDADCGAPSAQSCAAPVCVANVCSAVTRHDGSGGFVVDPPFGPEVNISDSQIGTSQQVVWDGSNFLAVYSSQGLEKARRISTTGSVVDAVAMTLDPNYVTLAVVNGSYLVATEEPSDPDFHSAGSWIGLYTMSTTGTITAAKSTGLYDAGANCGGAASNMVAPTLASTGAGYILSAANTCANIVRVAASPNVSFSLDPTMYSPSHPQNAGGGAGMGMIVQEGRIGGGHNEAWLVLWDKTGTPTRGYSVLDPWINPNPLCCDFSLGLAAGANSWLASYTRDNTTITFAPLTATGTSAGTPAVLGGGAANYVPPAMTFDGANFLVTLAIGGRAIPGRRIGPDGTVLDASDLSLTSSTASSPFIASDGHGHELIEYTKASDSNVYVRTMTTCP